MRSERDGFGAVRKGGRRVGAGADRHHFRTVGEASRFQFCVLVAIICVLVVIRLVLTARRFRDVAHLLKSFDPSDPFWSTAIGCFAVLLVAILLEARRRRRSRHDGDVTDYMKEAARRERAASRVPAPKSPDGTGGRTATTTAAAAVVLVPDASVAEASAIGERLAARGLRFELRQTAIDNAFHRFGNGGLGTRMCVLVHPDDCGAAQGIVDAILNG